MSGYVRVSSAEECIGNGNNGMKFTDRLVYWLAVPYSLISVIRDPGLSNAARLKAASFLLIPVIYALNPFDIVPDIFPLAGWADDLLVFPLFAWLSRKYVPEVDIATLQATSAAGSRRIVTRSLLVLIALLVLAAGFIAAAVCIGVRLLAD